MTPKKYLVLFCLQAVAAGAQPLPYEAKGQHLGVVNCASSLCHGSVSPWKDSNILQNEYVTWSRADKHSSRAYQVLFDERSKRIVANLGYKEPPHQVKLCLDCHSHNPPAARRGERFKATDGVSCEACHGPAEGWIRSHVSSGATHADNVAHGLYPTSDPVAQAKLCLSCHFGNKDKFVTHRIMGAGHPRMSFELDTFSQTQPPHFVIDADWVKRKGQWDTVRVWVIGQALAASELLDMLLDPKRSRDGLFPELVVFDCHACHHPMSDVRWTPRANASPGRIRLNDANLLMLRQIVRGVLPEARSREFNERVAQLHRAVARCARPSTPWCASFPRGRSAPGTCVPCLRGCCRTAWTASTGITPGRSRPRWRSAACWTSSRSAAWCAICVRPTRRSTGCTRR